MTTYAYDAEGRRVKKSSSFPGLTGESIFLYSGNQLVEEHSSAGSTWTIHGLGIDDVNRITKNGQNFYPLTNDQGSVYAVTDASGNVLQRYDYSPYGKVTVQDANGVILSDSEAIPLISRLYQGRELDQESGLLYYRARYYSPELGRFISHDPKLYVDGMNLYESFKGNPLRFTDPMGLWGEDIHYDASLQWANEYGFSDKDSKKIAKACNNVDKVRGGNSPFPIIGDQSYHFDTNKNATQGSSKDTRNINSEKHLEKAVEYEVKSHEIKNKITNKDGISNKISDYFLNKSADRNHTKAMKELGKGLHPKQDIDAHEDKNVKSKKAGPIEIKFHDSPELNNKPNLADDSEDISRVKKTQDKTKEYFDEFEDKVNDAEKEAQKEIDKYKSNPETKENQDTIE